MKSIGQMLAAVTVLLAVGTGCAANTDEPFDQLDESDIVGVTDLEKLEQAFGLTKDVQVNGKWTRSDAKLKAGECYASRLGAGSKDPQNWQFRRYKTGAAFFRKLNSGAATGDKRPIACVDIESPVDGMGATAIDGVMLDAALRYKLGAFNGVEGAAGHEYVAFGEGGGVEIRDADHFCGLFMDGTSTGPEPGYNAYNDELKKCSQQKGADCETSAMNACKWWTTIDQQADTMDRPSWGNSYVVGFPSIEKLAPVQAMLAYKYSLKKGTQSNVFSLTDDPVGTFVKIEGAGSSTAGYTVARYSRLDVHHLFMGGKEGVYVTPKSSDKKIAASAVASCERTVDAKGIATGKFVCKGL